jgi:Restriction Enzyme Adenine Methylase Associated
MYQRIFQRRIIMIENRNLTSGTKLVARYHKQSYSCQVAEGEDGKLRYQLEDGRGFKSPSAAGMAITGKSCNGWAFWSLAKEENSPATETQETETQQETPKTEETQEPEEQEQSKGSFFRTPNQKGVPEGQVRWYCQDCGESFLAPVNETPTACPKGHQPS